jgi:hypothetical protein
MENKKDSTLHIQINKELKNKFKLLCMLDGWTIQQRVQAMVVDYVKMYEYRIKNLDK